MRLFMLPVSIGAHVFVAIALVIVPLAAEVERPIPAPLRPMHLTTVVTVTPEIAAQVPLRRAAPVPAPSFATAPDVIAPERTTPAAAPSAGPGAAIGDTPSVDDGVTGDVGSTVAVGPPAEPAPRALPPAAPLRVGQGVREPRKIVDATPVYPALALSVKVEGAVILEAVINERGVVERLRVLKSVPLLDAAAMDAVSRWRYTPTLLNGTPVAVLMTITINFTLK
jgi:periplasmic protein TonB